MIIILLVLIILIILFFLYNRNYSESMINSAIIKGNVDITKSNDTNVRIKELCVSANNSSVNINNKCKIDSDCSDKDTKCIGGYCSRKNSANCLNESSIQILNNLPYGRKSTICIGDSCITEENLKFLRGEAPFNLITSNDTSQALTNTVLTYAPKNFIGLLNSKNKHLRDKDGVFTWDSEYIGPYESFILEQNDYISHLKMGSSYIYGRGNKILDSKYKPANEKLDYRLILKQEDDNKYSLQNRNGYYLSWKDNKVTWDVVQVTDTEKFSLVQGLTQAQMKADKIYMQKRNAAIVANDKNRQCVSNHGGVGYVCGEHWGWGGYHIDWCNCDQEYPKQKVPSQPADYDVKKNKIIFPYVNTLVSQPTETQGNDSENQSFYITNIKNIPEPVIRPPKITKIHYKKPNTSYNTNTININFNDKQTMNNFGKSRINIKTD